MLGLLVCGIFAATMSTMDSGMNRSAGIFVRNFYQPILNKQASEKRQLTVGKVATCLFGLGIIAVALVFDSWRQDSLFKVVLKIAVAIEIPLVIPLLFGMFVRRTPSWSGWSSALLGVGVGVGTLYAWDSVWLTSAIPGLTHLNGDESEWLRYFLTMVFVLTIGGGWFFFTSRWYDESSQKYRDDVDQFFETMNTPIDLVKENVANHDQAQYRIIGMLCLVYGGFVLLLALIPNDLTGRICFVLCGSLVLAVGALLYGISRRKSFDTSKDSTQV
jgi:SSS family solute:Na+ symporter